MNFDTVHEYHFYNGNNDMYYCEDHQTLILVNDTDKTNRIMVEGIKMDTIKSFVNTMNKKQLNENLEDNDHSQHAVEA